MLKLFKTSSPQKLFVYDCVTLYTSYSLETGKSIKRNEIFSKNRIFAYCTLYSIFLDRSTELLIINYFHLPSDNSEWFGYMTVNCVRPIVQTKGFER